MRTTIVTTTINIPVVLREYAENAMSYGHADVDFIVIGDRKSPPETADFCKTVPHYPCLYLDTPAQKDYLESFPELWNHLPFDSIQRRNIGILLAYERGAGVVITIDDDNHVMGQDFVGMHRAAGNIRELTAFDSSAGWFNVCSFFEADHGLRFYHRGYPWNMRWREEDHAVSSCRYACRVAVNVGLWLGDPDIDALTRMDRRPVVRALHLPNGESFALGRGTWSPFNSQNTALMRDAVPAYFLSPYIGRYDDIWAGYIFSRIAEHMGDAIVFGGPVVRQDRNPHDPWKDLDEERNGMIMTEDFCATLRSIPLQGSTYHECFGEVGEGLEERWNVGAHWTESQRELRSRLIEGMRVWHSVFTRMGQASCGLAPGGVE